MTKQRRGFTLIEIIVVLIILGVLTIIALNIYRWVKRSQAAEAYVNIKVTLDQVRVCYQMNGGQVAPCLFPSDPNHPNDPTFSTARFQYFAPGVLLSPGCVRMIAKDYNGPPSNVDCLCRGISVAPAGLGHSAVGKIMDIDTGVISDCTVVGGDYEGL